MAGQYYEWTLQENDGISVYRGTFNGSPDADLLIYGGATNTDLRVDGPGVVLLNGGRFISGANLTSLQFDTTLSWYDTEGCIAFWAKADAGTTQFTPFCLDYLGQAPKLIVSATGITLHDGVKAYTANISAAGMSLTGWNHLAINLTYDGVSGIYGFDVYVNNAFISRCPGDASFLIDAAIEFGYIVPTTQGYALADLYFDTLNRASTGERTTLYYKGATSLTAPGITSATTFNVEENTTGTIYTATATGGIPMTWSLFGPDSGLLTIGTGNGQVSFITPPNYEVPTDSGSNNTVIFGVRAVNQYGTGTQTITGTITDVIIPVNTTPPSITLPYFPFRGYSISASVGSWSGSPTGYNIQWERATGANGPYNVIPNANTTSYTIQPEDDGYILRFSAAGSTSEGVGSRYYSTGLRNFVYSPIPVGSPALTSQYDNLLPYSGKYLFEQHDLTTNPNPIFKTTSSPIADVDFNCFALGELRFGSLTHSYAPTLISPNYAMHAYHVSGNGTYYWQDANGNEITRTCSLELNKTCWNPYGDLLIVKLNTPVTGIQPARFIFDAAEFAGRQALWANNSWKLNIVNIVSYFSNAQAATTWTQSVDTSSKPIFGLVNRIPVVLALAHTANSGPSPYNNLSGIQAILASGGDNLSIVYKDNSSSYIQNASPFYTSNQRLGKSTIKTGRACTSYNRENTQQININDINTLDDRLDDYFYYEEITEDE